MLLTRGTVEMDMLSDSVSSLTPTYEDLVNAMTLTTAKLKLDWSVEEKESAPGRLDERVLAGHNKRNCEPSLPPQFL